MKWWRFRLTLRSRARSKRELRATAGSLCGSALRVRGAEHSAPKRDPEVVFHAGDIGERHPTVAGDQRPVFHFCAERGRGFREPLRIGTPGNKKGPPEQPAGPLRSSIERNHGGMI